MRSRILGEHNKIELALFLAAIVMAAGCSSGGSGSSSTPVPTATAAPTQSVSPTPGPSPSTGPTQTSTPSPVPTQVLGSNDILLVQNGGTTAILDPGASQAYTTSSLPAGLENGAMVSLQDGRVLYLGGDINGAASAKAWIWDSNVQVWTQTASLNAARSMPSATVLNNGMVLVAGGLPLNGNQVVQALISAELFNPSTNQFTLTGSMNIGRAGHSATLLPNNSVLVAGGESQNSSPTYLNSGEVYNPATGNWTAAANTMAIARFGHSANLLNDGQVLIAGTIVQSCGAVPCTTTELYDPASNSFSASGALNTARYNHSAVRLLDGRVMVAGGIGSGNSALTSSETYDAKTGTWTTRASLSVARANQAAVVVEDGRVFVAGGSSSAQTEYYANQSSIADFAGFNLPQAFGNSLAVMLWPRMVNQLPTAEGGSAYQEEDILNTTIRICVPGTTNCRTVGGIQIDSGSSGFRVFASQLGGVSLPQVTASDGGTVGDCEQYVNSAVWGAVANADLYIGNEKVTMPIQVMDDTKSFVPAPSNCTGLINTPSSFGANGLIGIDVGLYDGGLYYSCQSNGTCNSITPVVGQHVPSPIPLLPTDNNGSIVTLPPLATQSPLYADAAVGAYGTLTLGIGTETNNQPAAGVVVHDTDTGGYMKTVFGGSTYTNSYLDTGTQYYSFSTYAATGLPNCTQYPGWYCPAQTTTLSAVINGLTSGSSSVTFLIGSADTFFTTAPGQPTPYALDALGSPGGANTFAWGAPFFFGRSVYIAMPNASTPIGNGPYFAF
jgi:N-acetylneuraminic acid mutarotase